MKRVPAIALAVAAGAAFTAAQAQFSSRAPGSGSSANLNVHQSGTGACTNQDDGTTENALGLTAGGEMGWLLRFTTCTSTDHVDTAYGTLMFPGSVTNGNSSKLGVWNDADGDGNPTTGMALLHSQTVVVVNGDTDIVNSNALSGGCESAGTNLWLGASADQVAGEFPGPMDQDNPSANAWVVGSTLGPGTLDFNNLNNNNVPPLQMQAIGFPSVWLLRAQECAGSGPPGTPDCFGDGSGTVSCPCGNDGGAGTGGGCANGAPMPAGQGAVLSSSGSNSVAADDLVLTADFTTNQPGLFFQGNNSINGGNGSAFGDGLRCCGQNVVRLEIADPAGTNGPHTTSTTQAVLGTSPAGTTNAGDTRCYQWWYRNPNRSLCGANFNLSNSVVVTWAP